MHVINRQESKVFLSMIVQTNRQSKEYKIFRKYTPHYVNYLDSPRSLVSLSRNDIGFVQHPDEMILGEHSDDYLHILVDKKPHAH